MTGPAGRGSEPSDPASATQTTPGFAPAPGRGEPSFASGDVLAGRFRIVRFVAHGGMGEVYEAQDLELREEVALKTVRADIAGEAQAHERFRTEIHLARQVTHQNVCRIFDVFHHQAADGAPVTFLTMELLRGETLEERLRRGRLASSLALALARQIAAALDAAHQAGVVHRDLKSGNVMLVAQAEAPEGLRAVVTDFGLARRAGPSALASGTASLADRIVGTPAYMAPEQVAGGPVGAAADVYAFGVVLYEMLTGARPFNAETPLGVMLKRLSEPPPSPRRLVHDLDPRAEAAILRCLERDPADRFASAGEAVRALAGQEAAPGSGRRAGRRLAWSAALALVVAAGLFAWMPWRRSPAPARQADPAPAASVVKRRVVAVLGFKNLAGRAEAAWLSTALGEMLGSELAAGETVRVVPGESVFRLRAELLLEGSDALAPDTLRRVRALLGADLLVLGSYTALGAASGGKLRLDLRLQDAAAGETVLAVTEAGTEADLFELITRAGARLRERLGAGPLSGAQAGAVRGSLPGQPSAARPYAEGLARLRLFDALGARPLLERALAADPRHPLIHRALSETWSLLGYEGRARDEAQRAFELAADLPRADRLAVEARRSETSGDWAKAVELHRSLLGLFPDDLESGLNLAAALRSAGQGREALAVFDNLHRLPAPAGQDPRVDVHEATTARLLSQTQRALEAARRAAAAASSLGARHLLARARFEEGSALQNLGQPDAAQAALEDARRIFAELDDRRGVAGSLNNLALVYANRGDLATAQRLSEEAVGHYRAIGNRSGEALLEGNLGNLRYFRGDFAGAERQWRRTLATYREIADLDGVARMLTNIASARADQGDIQGGVRTFEEAVPIWREVGHKAGTASTLHNLGKARHQLGELAASEAAFQESLALFAEIGDKAYEAAALHDHGDLLLARGDRAGARRRYEQALALREGMGERTNAALTRLALAEVLIDENRAGEAVTAARQAQEALGAAGDDAARAQATLALALAAQGQAQAAIAAAFEARRLAAASQSRALRAAVAVAALSAAPADPRSRAAERDLRALLADDRQALPLGLRLEARAILAAGRPGELAALEAEARERGFVRIAARVQPALSSVGPPATRD